VPYRIRRQVAEQLEAECRAELDAQNAQNALDKQGGTIVIEAARGGPNGAAFPLTPPYGYETAFQTLSTTILERSAVLYIWVEPRESRRKNIERGRPDGAGSILHHSVPMEVMLAQYGTDDIEHLLAQSDRPGSLRIERLVERDGRYHTRVFHVPVGRFDNRADLTTFVRQSRDAWGREDVQRLHHGLREAFAQMRR
jgi:hypothetical protein